MCNILQERLKKNAVKLQRSLDVMNFPQVEWSPPEFGRRRLTDRLYEAEGGAKRRRRRQHGRRR